MDASAYLRAEAQRLRRSSPRGGVDVLPSIPEDEVEDALLYGCPGCSGLWRRFGACNLHLGLCPGVGALPDMDSRPRFCRALGSARFAARRYTEGVLKLGARELQELQEEQPVAAAGITADKLGATELQQQEPVAPASIAVAAPVTSSGASSNTSSSASAKESFFLCYGEIWRVSTDHLGKESIAAYTDGRPLPARKIAPRDIPAVDLFPFMKKKVPATGAASGVASSSAPATAVASIVPSPQPRSGKKQVSATSAASGVASSIAPATAVAPTVPSPQPPSAVSAPATAIAPTGPLPRPPSAAAAPAAAIAPTGPLPQPPGAASGVPKPVAKSGNRRSWKAVAKSGQR